MRFRTEIEPQPRLRLIEPSTPLLLVGSCFSDNIGALLERDGFRCVHNPLGPLFNPLSMANALAAAAGGRVYTPSDLTEGPLGLHCLDYASRYSGDDAAAVCGAVNADLGTLRSAMATSEEPPLVVLTFGSAYSYYLDGITAVGNCHKLPAQRFERRRLSVGQSIEAMEAAIAALPAQSRVVLTVSPVRHLDEGLHGNTLCKAILHLACESVIKAHPDGRITYFPAYEMLNDDLRDYRFYADDMKHPSPVAVDYIYSHFRHTYFTDSAMASAEKGRKASALAAHRKLR